MKNYELDKKCGERLDECMKQAKMSGTMLANKANKYYEVNGLSATKNMSQQKISTIVQGRVHLKKEDAELFAMILNVDADYLLGHEEYKTRFEKSSNRRRTKLEREELYYQILELHGYKLITTVSDLKEVTTDSLFINSWITKNEKGIETVSLHLNDKECSRVFFLYDTKNKKLSPHILMDDFYKIIEDIDYHFRCSLERPFREYREMWEYAIPVRIGMSDTSKLI